MNEVVPGRPRRIGRSFFEFHPTPLDERMAEKNKNSEVVLEDLFFWWDELDRQDLPSCCMYCGSKDSDWIDLTFETSRYENFKNYRVTRKSSVPLCGDHSAWPIQIRADDFDKIGVWLRNVGDDYRVALKRYRKKEQKEWEEENDGADPEDFEDRQLPPALRTEPAKPKKPSNWWWLVAVIFLFIIMVPGAAIACFVFMIFGGVFGGLFLGRKK